MATLKKSLWTQKRRPLELKPYRSGSLRGAEAPLFHGAAYMGGTSCIGTSCTVLGASVNFPRKLLVSQA
jgi:hypothetical protein